MAHSRAEWKLRFDTPDVEELWLDDDQRAILLEMALDFAVSLAENQRLRGSASTAMHFSGVTVVTFALPAAVRTAWHGERISTTTEWQITTLAAMVAISNMRASGRHLYPASDV